MEQRTIAGRYVLDKRIGSGGMATVWRATDQSLGRPVAIKLLHAGLASDESFVERFRREARHAASLSHPNIVTVYDTGEDGDDLYIIMELVEGTNLHQILKRNGPLSVEQTAVTGTAILGALHEAHAKGIVHRDIKPGNVMVNPEGTIKVTDFGIAKGMAEASGLTQTGTMMGTASYLSPEQTKGEPAGPASDLYATGIVLFECLTGSPPFTGDSPVAIALMHQRDPVPSLRAQRPDVPVAFESTIMRALSKDPAARFESAAAMTAAVSATGLNQGDQPTMAVASAPTIAAAAPPPMAARPAGATQTIRRPVPPPSRTGRFLKAAFFALIAGALIWLAAALAQTTFKSEATPSPVVTASPTVEPTATPEPTTTPRPTASPTPRPTEEPAPTPTPTAAIRTPRPPSTPFIPTPFNPTPAPTP